MDAVLGEAAFSITDDKVSITELRVHAVAGLSLTLQPSPGNSHTMVAKATGLQTLTAPKQVDSIVYHVCVCFYVCVCVCDSFLSFFCYFVTGYDKKSVLNTSYAYVL